MSSYKTESEKDVLRLSNEASHQLAKECIQTALVDLMAKKPLQKITISEIITRSGISRSAFYRNYSSKEDVIKEISDELFIFIREYAIAHDAKKGTYSFFHGIFSAIRQNEKSIRLLLQVSRQQGLPERTFPVSILEMLWPSETPEEHYGTIALEGACGRIFLDWFQNGMTESVEYMAEFCSSLADRILSFGRS